MTTSELEHTQANLQMLLDRNKDYIEQYKNNPLMQLIQSSEMEKQEVRIRLLDCIQVFSNHFQRVVLLRHALCNQPEFAAITYQHLKEEFGHNISLMQDRNNRPLIWDPILEATSSWFAGKMFMLNEEEKTVLVHLVLEASANIFFHAAHNVMQQYGETDYFKIHSDLDEAHEKMGIMLLIDINHKQYCRLMVVQEQGWHMINTFCERTAALVI